MHGLNKSCQNCFVSMSQFSEIIEIIVHEIFWVRLIIKKKHKSPLANSTVRGVLVDASLRNVSSQARGFRTDEGKTSKLATVSKLNVIAVCINKPFRCYKIGRAHV